MTEFQKKVKLLEQDEVKGNIYPYAFGYIASEVEIAKQHMERGKFDLALSYIRSADLMRAAVKYIKTGVSDYV